MRLIDADELKEDLRHYFTDSVLDGVSAKLTFNQILHDIDNSPTVDKGYNEGHIDGILAGEKLYARPIGKWIPINDKRGKEIACVCSACKKNPKYDVHSAHCPNCGAEMKGGMKNE